MRRLSLTRLALKRAQTGATCVGDPCVACRANGRDGTIGVYTTRREPGLTIRYLQCRVCGWKPPDNKWAELDTPLDQ